MANRNWASGGKVYSMHVKPVLIDLKFTVDATNAIGITSLKGPCVSAVYMHSTNGTPSGPNPATGYIVVRLTDNYASQFQSISGNITAANSGSDVKIDNSAMTTGQPYVITTLGNATAAKWHAVGVPAGVTPAANVAFVAASNGGAGNTLTSRVQTVEATTPVLSIQQVGSVNASINPDPTANQGYGAQLIFVCRKHDGTVIAPTDGSTIHLSLYLSDSSIQIGGE